MNRLEHARITTRLIYDNSLRKLRDHLGDVSCQLFLHKYGLDTKTHSNALILKQNADAIQEVHSLWEELEKDMGAIDFNRWIQHNRLQRDQGHYHELLRVLNTQRKHLLQEYQSTRVFVGGKEAYDKLKLTIPIQNSRLQLDRAIRIQHKVNLQIKRRRQVEDFVGGIETYETIAKRTKEEKNLDKKNRLIVQYYIDRELPKIRHQVQKLLDNEKQFDILKQLFLDLMDSETVVNKDYCELQYWKRFL